MSGLFWNTILLHISAGPSVVTATVTFSLCLVTLASFVDTFASAGTTEEALPTPHAQLLGSRPERDHLVQGYLVQGNEVLQGGGELIAGVV